MQVNLVTPVLHWIACREQQQIVLSIYCLDTAAMSLHCFPACATESVTQQLQEATICTLTDLKHSALKLIHCLSFSSQRLELSACSI